MPEYGKLKVGDIVYPKKDQWAGPIRLKGGVGYPIRAVDSMNIMIEEPRGYKNEQEVDRAWFPRRNFFKTKAEYLIYIMTL